MDAVFFVIVIQTIIIFTVAMMIDGLPIFLLQTPIYFSLNDQEKIKKQARQK